MATKGNTYTLKEVVEHFLTDMKRDIGEIKFQTQKTNGRVNSLEKSRIQIWTTISVLLIVGGVITALSVMVIDSKIQEGLNTSTAQIDTKIKNGLDAALNERCGNPCVEILK